MYLLFCATFLVNLTISAQTFNFKNYTTKDGLLTDEIYNLHQDKEGYIWAFSKYGTLKYTGSEFKHVLQNLPFKDSFIYSIYENASGRKWVANSNARIYEIRNDSAIIIKGIEAISESLRNSVSEIVALYVDDSLNIYAMTKGHSYKFIKKGGRYVPIELCEDMKSDCILIRALKAGNTLLPVYLHKEENKFMKMCSTGHIYLELPIKNGYKSIQLPSNYLKSSVRNIKLCRNAIYFTSHNYLYRYIEKSNELLCRKIHNSVILNYTLDSNNHLWLGCYNDGLYELDENDSIINHFFLGTTVNDVLIDQQNSIWLSTSNAGLFHFRNISHQHFEEPELLGTNISLLEKIGTKLFIGNSTGAVFFIENNKITKIRQSDNNEPIDIEKHNGDYRISFRFSNEKFDLDKNRHSKTSTINEPTATSIISKSADTLISVWRKGIMFYVNDKAVKQIDFGCKILCGFLNGNRLLLGTENGVYEYPSSFHQAGKKIGGILVTESETLIAKGYLAPTLNSIVTSIAKDNRNNIWFTTEGNGIFIMNGKAISHFTVKDGLPSDIVNNISFTEKHIALLSTNKGLFISDSSYKNGVQQNWECIFEGEVQKALLFEDKVYINSKNGLGIIDYDIKILRPKKLFLNLSSIRIDSILILPTHFSEIKSTDNSVEFKFDAISLSDEKPLIKYVLKGERPDHGYLQNSTVKFNHLYPGSYTLVVLPVKAQYSDLKIEIPFKVVPAFWQNFIFQILLFISALFIITSIIWWSVKRSRKKEALKIKNEQLILEYKLIALKAQINPHFMSNCLSAIQNLILDNETAKANYYLAEFGLLVRYILDYSSMQLITLEEELDLIKIYLRLEQLRFENKFIFKIHVENDIPLNKTYLPPLILNPIIENAIWHGLLPVQRQRAGELHIIVIKNQRNLILTIQDNGKGQGAEKAKLRTNNTKSYGIKITEQRLSSINFLYNREDSRVVYDDLADPEHNSSGTRVTIFLPNNLNPQENDED
ncbi:MAG: histidine kinase [Bacteroidetes bacterium]|nr:histidine kinase [Bacteroidota bacterium]